MQNLLITDKDGIRIITFNRPKALNALNSQTLDELFDVLQQTKTDTSIGVVILTGAGERSFIAGADIKEMQGMTSEQAKEFSQKGHRVLNAIEDLPQPVIAAVNGFALGGGTEMALACDFIYASSKALFGLPEVSLGLIPGFGGTQRLSRKIPVGMAREIVFSGEKISAEIAHQIGLVNKVFSPEELLEGAEKTARIILKRSSMALAAAKYAMRFGHDKPLEEGCQLEIDQFAKLFQSDHPKEGTTAFIERREPEFTRIFPTE